MMRLGTAQPTGSETSRLYGMRLIAVLTFCAAPVSAASLPGSISGKLSFATDYIFRGISQTQEKPQLLGQVTWSHDSGLYSGVWSSNTHFGGPGNSIEIDPFIGFARDIGDTSWSYDVGYWHYHYPGARSNIDYGEYYGILSYAVGRLTMEASLWYAPDYFGDDFFGDEPSLAYHGTLTYALPRDYSLSLRAGEQTFDEPDGLRNQDYVYYVLTASKTWDDVTFELAAHDTDNVRSDLAAADQADSRLVARLSFTF